MLLDCGVILHQQVPQLLHASLSPVLRWKKGEKTWWCKKYSWVVIRTRRSLLVLEQTLLVLFLLTRCLSNLQAQDIIIFAEGICFALKSTGSLWFLNERHLNSARYHLRCFLLELTLKEKKNSTGDRTPLQMLEPWPWLQTT